MSANGIHIPAGILRSINAEKAYMLEQTLEQLFNVISTLLQRLVPDGTFVVCRPIQMLLTSYIYGNASTRRVHRNKKPSKMMSADED